jgi:hypothetical protein
LLDRPDINLLVSLREAAEQYRTGEMREIMRSLERHRYQGEHNDLILWLRRKIENLEYYDVATRLASLEEEGIYD